MRALVLLTCVGCTFEGGPLVDAGMRESPDAREAPTDAGTEGPPIQLEIGTGADTFEPLVNGQLVELEYGIQGGFHLWAAVRIQDATPGGVTLTVTLEDQAGIIFRQRHRRLIASVPADVVGMRALIEPDMVDTSSVALIITARGEDGRHGEDRRVVEVRGER